MDFKECMNYVEKKHGFPSLQSDRHGKRTAWLLKEASLLTGLSSVPHAVIAGTCGKASTALFLAYIVSEHFALTDISLPVGIGTKPPLIEDEDGSRERYQLLFPAEKHTEWISEADFVQSLSRIRPLVEKYQRNPHLGEMASYDIRMAVLSDYFIHRGAGFCIYEANIGYRHDPTSALENIDVAVLSTMDEAHLEQLSLPDDAPCYLSSAGRSAGPIYHKVGGLKKNRPAVIGYQLEENVPAILRLAGDMGAAPLMVYGEKRDFFIHRSKSTLQGSDATITVGGRQFDIEIHFLGAFQLRNAVLAAASAHMLWQRGVLKGSESLLEESIKSGLRKAVSHGRLQYISDSPAVILTTAGTEIKWRSTLDAIDELMDHSGRDRLVVAATFLTRDEDVRKALGTLLSSRRLKAFLPTSYLNDRDTVDADPMKIISWCRESMPDVYCEHAGDPFTTYRRAIELADPEKDAVLLIGKGIAAALLRDSSGILETPAF